MIVGGASSSTEVKRDVEIVRYADHVLAKPNSFTASTAA